MGDVFDSKLCGVGVIVNVLLVVCLVVGIGLSVKVLFTPVPFFVDDGDAAAGVTTLRAVTVSALFLLIAATASLVESFCFALICTGFRIIDAGGRFEALTVKPDNDDRCGRSRSFAVN